MGNVQLTKLVFKNIVDPKKAIALLPETENTVVGGTIIGIANGVKISKGTDGITEIYGLKGSFEGTPADPTKDTVSSGVCYLPEAFQGPIIAALQANDGPDSVQFVAELLVMRATNPQGYTWGLRPVGEIKQADPLQALRSQLPAVKALAAPEAEKVAVKK